MDRKDGKLTKTDLNKVAYSVVSQATAQIHKSRKKDPAAIDRGLKGGLARAKSTSAEELNKDGRLAANSCWNSQKEASTG